MSSQKHGIIFESDVIMAETGHTKKEYEVGLPGGSSSKFDIVKGHKGATFNGSVKVSNSNTVGCGDVRRIYEASETLYTVITGLWGQRGKDKVVNEIIEFHMKPEYHTLLWGDITLDVVSEYIDMVKGIPYGESAQKENKPIWEQRVKEIRKGRGLIQINTKVDSEGQRRVQCSFLITDFIKNGIPYERFTEKYNGIKLPHLIVNSPSRTFNGK
jgi:hypothetical protein